MSPPSSNFIDSLSWHNFFFLYTAVLKSENQLQNTDNIVFDLTLLNLISGDLTGTISDHLHKFLIALNIF